MKVGYEEWLLRNTNWMKVYNEHGKYTSELHIN